MRLLVPPVLLLLSLIPVAAQTWVSCVVDSQGNKICAGTQAGKNICGYTRVPFGGNRPYSCYDVVVQKTAPNGQAVSTRVMGGENSETPRQVLLDSSGNAAVVGTTQSTGYPATPDALERALCNPRSRPLLIDGRRIPIELTELVDAGSGPALPHISAVGSARRSGVRDSVPHAR